MFAKKKAAFQNRAATDQIPDFSRETPVQTVLSVSTPAPIDRRWVDRAKQLSAVFAGHPDIESSEVWISEAHGTSFYLNSEGFKVVSPVSTAYLRITADARAEDGMTVPDVYAAVESRFDDLPPMPELLKRAGELASQVKARRSAWSATSSLDHC